MNLYNSLSYLPFVYWHTTPKDGADLIEVNMFSYKVVPFLLEPEQNALFFSQFYSLYFFLILSH